MLILNLVECALSILDIIERADRRNVPLKTIVKHSEFTFRTLETVCARMSSAKIIRGMTGPYGGYVQIRPVTLLELVKLLTPTRAPAFRRSCNDRVNRVQKRVMRLYEDVVIMPKSGSEFSGVKDTAHTDSHGPTDGPPIEEKPTKEPLIQGEQDVSIIKEVQG